MEAKIGALEKEITSYKAAKELLVSRMEKLSTDNEGLRRDLETERSSSQALTTQNILLTKWLEDARVAGVSAAKAYQTALAGFGGVTSALPFDASTYGLFAWFKDNFLKLPEFVGGAVDFGALPLRDKFEQDSWEGWLLALH